MKLNEKTNKFQFWVDRGGTFTDIVACKPDGTLVTHKLLSENPDRYSDAVIQGIRDILGITADQPIPSHLISEVKMGTTVATNALLERQGDRTVLVITKGFKDALRIGYQNRPDIFARQIILPELLYEQVIEVEERYDANGNELKAVETESLKTALQHTYNQGIKSCAIVLMHGYRYPQHEQKIAKIAEEIGFTQISVSHQVSPLMKLISRGDTTVIDAYLSPILYRYIDRVSRQINSNDKAVKLMFMQSNGGLVNAQQFQGKDSILSGPAGGIVGAVQTSLRAGFNKIISFDMGGTSTDVAHYHGEYERQFETEIAGVRMRTPIMAIHTVAAGGGSILVFDGSRYRVGPESAGANPGAACYRVGGPLTVTDCNVMLGKIQPQFFPKVFGVEGNLPLDGEIVREKFTELAITIQQQTGNIKTPEEVATGFITIAVENMANAIKKISLQRGYDVSDYALCCFGGAGGQHACLIADTLGIKTVFIHPYAGVLSAYGMGLADIRVIRERSVETVLNPDSFSQLKQIFLELETECNQELADDSENQNTALFQVNLKYIGTDSILTVHFANSVKDIITEFEEKHQQRYGFIKPEKALIVESISVEIIQHLSVVEEPQYSRTRSQLTQPISTVKMYTANQWQDTPLFQREELQPGDLITGPAIITEGIGTNIIEPGWQAEVTDKNHLVLTRQPSKTVNNTAIAANDKAYKPDPVRLEIFKNLFQFIAEQMGIILQNTASSVNIKERLDFSCAIFDAQGELVANAPHIPVHLGSMSESVRSLIQAKSETIKPGDVYLLNNPYEGGTHLPDVTVITPVFDSKQQQILFYVASRGHQADIGGITPGSMPPYSTTVEEEGILLTHFQLVKQGEFQETALREILTSGKYPARNPDVNLADLQAQIAANEKGVQELHRMVNQYGLETVQTYMGYVQDNAEESVRKAIDVLKEGEFTYQMDTGSQIKVKITLDKINRNATIDFSGTSRQLQSNFNAPKAVCMAAVLYVFRTLVTDNIPLNAGCLKPLNIIIPEGCMLNPQYPAAVVAGNVETSQVIVDALYGALGVMAASQGTMNNFTFGNQRYQYYETICGGSGAGSNFDGTDAVHTHMTNSRLTDPEVLEWRFPVLLEEFSIRPNSGGMGKHRGGNGIIRRIQFLEAMTAAILSGHRQIPPFGLEGGEPGLVGQNTVIRQDGNIEKLGSTATVEMQPGDVFVIETPGGGGYFTRI